MPGKLILFPRPLRRHEPEIELESGRIVFEIGDSRFAVDVTTSFTVTELPSGPGPVIPIPKTRYRKR